MQRCGGSEEHGNEGSMSGPQQVWGRRRKMQSAAGNSAAFAEITQTGRAKASTV